MEIAPLNLSDVVRAAVANDAELALVEAVQASRRTGAREDVTVETVFTEGANPLDLLLLESRDPRARVERAGRVRVLWLSDDSGEWMVSAWPSGSESVFHLVTTVHSTDRRWKWLERWLRSTRDIVPVFLNHEDFEAIGLSLAELGDVEVGRVTARSVVDGSSDSRGWKASGPISRPTPSELIARLEADFFAVKTLTLHVESILSLHLRRVAGATFYSGDFGIFSEHVLGALARAAGRRRALLIGRERKLEQASRPISIRLGSEVLDSPEATGLLLAEVSSLPRVSMAVFHRNPYLHVAVTDEVDGSSCDIIVTQADAIDIYPGYRSSPAALERIAQRLGDRFGADRIIDRPQQNYSLSSLSLA